MEETMSNETNAVAVKEENNFAIFNDKDLDLATLLEDNMGDEEFTPLDLERIIVPAGGGTTFEVPTLEGMDDVKELEAIIIHIMPAKSYWEGEYDGENVPPDCTSIDGIHGTGNPGGLCSECPFNEYGSAAKGSGKACKDQRNVFILPKDAILPFTLSVPPTSIKPLKKYMTSLTRFGKSLYSVSTKISLEKTKSGSGITYSRLVFKAGDPLTTEQAALVKQYKKAFKQIFEHTKVESDAA
jgi:hypothetical protein